MVDIAFATKVMGAAEGSYFNRTDLRHVASKASPASGLSFGVTQLDTSQGPGRAALQLILQKKVGGKGMTPQEADQFLGRFAGNSAKGALSAEEQSKIDALLQSSDGMSIVQMEDEKRIKRLINIVEDLMREAAASWAGRKPPVPAPSLSDPENGDYKGLFAYLAATLNKNESNRGPLADWLKGRGIKLSGSQTPRFLLTSPPGLKEFHELAPNLRVWSGANGNYDNLRGRMKFVDSNFK